MAYTLERYVLRQTLLAFLLGLLAMTGLLYLGMAGSLMQRGYNILQVRSVWGFLLLYSLPYAVPMALLFAVVMTFGRMSGDNEILAARSSGVRPARLALPVLMLGAALSVGSLWLNHWALPTAYLRVHQFREAVFRMLIENLGVTERMYEIHPYQIYVHSVDPETGEWLHVVIFHAEGPMVRRVMRAERARSLVSEEQERARILLHRCFVLEPAASSKAVEALDRWMQAGPAQASGMAALPGSVTSGPMDMSIDIDLSTQRRRDLDRADMKVLPDLLEEIRETSARLTDLPPVRRPLTERQAREQRRDRLYRELQRQRQRVAELAEAVAEIEEEARQVGLEAEHARSLLAGRGREMERVLEREQRLAQEEADLQRELAEAEAEDENEDGEASDTSDARERLEERLASARSARQQARAEAHVLAEDVERIEQRLQALEARVAEKERRLAAARDLLEEAEAQADAARKDHREAAQARSVAQAHESHALAVMELHSRNASATVCLAFVLVGFPLGLLAKRGNIVYALALSSAVALLLYYPLTMVAHMLAIDRYLPPAAAFWAPVAIVAALGLLLQALAFRR